MGSIVETFGKLGQQLKNGWSNLKPVQRVVIAAVGVSLFAALIFVAIRSGNPEYVPLYSDLAEGDAADVVNALREAGTNYKLAENGTAILVPKADVYQTRLDMAAKGLPKSGVVGFEIFQQFSFGSTDFERNIKYTWALQGELTRTIRELDEVEDARVHIAIPEKSLFLREQQPPTASVLLQLRPGARLSTAQVNGITYLVAHSIESMKPEDVTVIDTAGNVLSKPVTPELASSDAAMQRLDIQRTFERDVEQHLQSMLEPVYGAGRALVRVKADMNFDSEDETLEIFEKPTPDGLVRSSKTQEESSGSAAVGGVTGVSGTIPGYGTPESTNNSTNYQRKSAEINYEVNRTERHRVVAPGRVMGLSVAVWIDGDLTTTEKDQVRNTVLAAISGSARRSDVVTVESMPFRSRLDEEQRQAGTLPTAAALGGISIWIWVGAGALLGLLGTLGLVLVRRRRLAARVDITLPEETAAEEKPALPAEQAAIVAAVDDVVTRRKTVENMAKERPSEFANLVRIWLAEE